MESKMKKENIKKGDWFVNFPEERHVISLIRVTRPPHTAGHGNTEFVDYNWLSIYIDDSSGDFLYEPFNAPTTDFTRGDKFILPNDRHYRKAIKMLFECKNLEWKVK
jgi:hypothetical protein